MEVEEKVDSQKKLDQWKKNAKAIAKSQRLSRCAAGLAGCALMRSCSRSCKMSINDGMMFFQSIKGCGGRSQSDRVHRTERDRSRRTWASGFKTMSLRKMLEDPRMKMEDDDKKARKNPWPKRNRMRKSEACKLETKGKVAVQKSRMNGVWILLSCKVSSRQEHIWHGSGSCFSLSELEKTWMRSISRRQPLQCMSQRDEKNTRSRRGSSAS